MIAVAAINTAIDRLVDVDALTPGLVIRASDARAWPGGKGVHVAACAAALGEKVRLTGLADAEHREFLTAWLGARGVEFYGIDTPTAIRTCLAIRDRSGCVTEILEPGPYLDESSRRAVADAVDSVSRNADVVVVTGSVPRGLPATMYRDVVARLRPIRVLVDASGDLLRHALDAAPFAIKPNRAEAAAATGTVVDSPKAAALAAQSLASTGVSLVVISLGEEGAVACWEGHVCHVVPPRAVALNAVGAGDCVTAGIAVALARGNEIVDALRLGVAAGTAKVLSPETGIVRRDDIDAVLKAIVVEWL